MSREKTFRRKTATVCLAIFFLLLTGASSPAAEKDEAWGFVVPLGTNMQSENLVALLRRVTEVVSKAVDLSVEVYTPGYIIAENTVDIIEEYFRSGKASLAYAHPRDMVEYMENGGTFIYPIATVEMFGKTSTDVCFYTRKRDGHVEIADLKGKVMGAGHTLASVYRILYENEIEEPPEKFFSKTVFIADFNKNELINALFDGRADVIAAEEYNMIVPLGSHERGKEVEALHCSEQYNNWMFVAGRMAPLETIDQVQRLFYGAHKDRKFQEFWWFLAAIKGRFVPVSDGALDRTRELIKLEDRLGWYEKEKKFMRENWSKFEKEKNDR